MKKLLIVLAIFILSGCNEEQEEYLNEIDVDIAIITYETGTQSKIIQEVILDTFEIIEIELLETGFAEFPYVSIFIEREEWGKYVDIIKSMFDDEIELNNNGLSGMVGPKAKIIITLQSGNSILKCEFYQGPSNQVVGASIKYISGEDINAAIYIYDETDEYDEIYTRLNNVIID